MHIRKKKWYLSVLLLTLFACNGPSQTENTKKTWIEQAKQYIQPIIIGTNNLFVSRNLEQKPIENKLNKTNATRLQGQGQMLGIMQNINAPTDNKTAPIKLTTKTIAQYHHDYDKARTVDDKRDALVTWVKMDKAHAVTILQDAYTDSEPELRKEAVLQMLAFNDQPIIIDLLLKALDDPDSLVVIEAVEGLAHVREPRTIAGLKKIAATHPDEEVRIVAQDYVERLIQNKK